MIRGTKQSVACLVTVWAILSATARAEDLREVKPIASARDNERSASFGSFYLKKDGVVIRSAEDLVATTIKKNLKNDPEVQKAMEAELRKHLKVEAIDWNKQIVLGIIGEGFDSLKTDGKVLTATYVPYKEPLTRAIPPTPKMLVLIERVEGEVKFVPKK